MVSTTLLSRLQLQHLVSINDFDLLEGDLLKQSLSCTPKTIPAQYFYDERGSLLFEQICLQPEYYVTGTEVSILQRIAPLLPQQTGPCELVELGSGSSLKTHILLDAYQNHGLPLHYTPIDISSTILEASAHHLLADYPQLQIHGIVGTYEQSLANLAPSHLPCRLIYILGSSLGNLTPQACSQFFDRVAAGLAVGDYFLLGVDLQKDQAQLEAAYNDAQGVTAEFNLNMLHHLNRRFGANFVVEQFEHLAIYNADSHQIEMHLRSKSEQVVHFQALDFQINLKSGEKILTEISRKFNTDRLVTELRGFSPVQIWQDDNKWFGLLLMQKTGT